MLIGHFVPIFSGVLSKIFLCMACQLPTVFLDLNRPLSGTIKRARCFCLVIKANRCLACGDVKRTGRRIINLWISNRIIRFRFCFSFLAVRRRGGFRFSVPIFQRRVLRTFNRGRMVIGVTLNVTVYLGRFCIGVSGGLFRGSFLRE